MAYERFTQSCLLKSAKYSRCQKTLIKFEIFHKIFLKSHRKWAQDFTVKIGGG